MNILLKPLFLILLTLSLSVFNTAQAKWANDAKGCKIWLEGKTTGQPPNWSGSCKNGYATGKGKVNYNYSAPTEVKSCSGTMNKGKLQGYANCVLKTGDSFSGTIKNGKIVGKGVYKWKARKNCPTCARQYSGTFHNSAFAFGSLLLSNGQKIKLLYHPTKKGCLVWNPDPKPGEVITWTGACQGGYANGNGVLTYSSRKETETTRGTLKNGMIEGHAVVDGKHTSACNNCIVHYDGMFKFHNPIKGVATLGNGRKVQHNVQQQQMSKIASDSMKFQLAMMKLQQQMAMTRAMTDLSNTASCYMSPGCTMEYQYVPGGTLY
jgi:hypothetical protein